ncbi:AAA family ATPase [Chryseobacterium hagamense]|uniref:Chromosome segregation protein SMC n=1 Tax=Chryseobacterium hagamense TaxID=395935 RepID=A0A511YQK4_9FLAO|nr:AAA family ATPase [Chryseobacterium hagamense]GEN77475.1 chromosome segregation protein SMC [Chryseobacterium hagamense]
MNRIQIEGYKSIKTLDLELAPINILIGANGSGKSNFLSFFELLSNIYNRNLRQFVSLRGGTDKFLHKGDKFTEEIKTKLTFPKTNGYSFTLKPGDDGFIFVHEGLWYDNPFMENPVEIASFSYESKLIYNSKPRARYIRNYLTSLQKYHFHDTGDNSPFNKSSNIENDDFLLYDKGQNIASFLFSIYENNRQVYNFIIKTIQSIAPYFLDFILRPDENNNIKLRWQSSHSSTIYGVNDLSDGTIRFIALTVLFMQPNLPHTIIIDEPELGLHPSAIAKLAGMIKSVSKKNCQVIVATQSTDLISHFEPEDIITVDQINGESIFERLNSKTLSKWLDDFTIDDLWKRNIITGGQPNFE